MSNLVSIDMISETSLSWFTFRQNNSGGSFMVNDYVAQFVSVQAASVEEASATLQCYATNAGSCSCCGDRWNFDFAEKGRVPVYAEQPLYLLLGTHFGLYYEARLHRYDGSVLKLTEQGIKDDPKLFEELKQTA